MRLLRASAAAAVLALGGCTSSPPSPTPRFVIVGDAIASPLTSLPGRPDEGRRIVADRQVGLCLLCHSGPFPEVRFQGDLGTDLAGTGSRWSEGQLRLRLVDPAKLNPQTIMPAYYRVDSFARVGEAWRDKPVLQAQQIEDVVAFLRTLR
jgi:L-cysteine S-thiosulfotransferase